MKPTGMQGWDIVVDTNIIFSFLMTGNPTISAVLRYIIKEHHLLLSSYIVEELQEKIAEKLPEKLLDLQAFLEQPNLRILESSGDWTKDADIFLRDTNDRPILALAMKEADALVTGDHDFLHMKGKEKLPFAILSVEDFVRIFGYAGLNRYLAI